MSGTEQVKCLPRRPPPYLLDQELVIEPVHIKIRPCLRFAFVFATCSYAGRGSRASVRAVTSVRVHYERLGFGKTGRSLADSLYPRINGKRFTLHGHDPVDLFLLRQGDYVWVVNFD